MAHRKEFKPRPYWHVDFKWITGLALVFVLTASLFGSVLLRITAEENAVDILTVMMAAMFSPEGLDAPADVQAVFETFQAGTDGSVNPFQGLNVTMRESEIEGLSPREIRLYVFRQIAAPFYEGGPEAVLAPDVSPELREQFTADTALMTLFTRNTYNRLRALFGVLAVLCTGLIGLLVLFSYRYGKLASPGCVLVLSGLPLALLFTILNQQFQNPVPPGQEASIGDRLEYVVAEALPGMIRSQQMIYVIVTVLGLVLLAVGWFGIVFLRKTSPEKQETG